jgi:phosphatidylglycerol---prolipoprotein diacylglyceryl transferase
MTLRFGLPRNDSIYLIFLRALGLLIFQRIKARFQRLIFLTGGSGHIAYNLKFFPADEIHVRDKALNLTAENGLCLAPCTIGGAGHFRHHLGNTVKKGALGLHGKIPFGFYIERNPSGATGPPKRVIETHEKKWRPSMSLPYPAIDPVLIKIGPLPIRWYSLAYIAGIAGGWWYVTRLIANMKLWGKSGAPITKTLLDDVIFWVAIGTIAGGRLGFVLFYDPSLLIAPWTPILGFIPFPPALMLWQGGMSFHGGLLGVTVAGFLFARKYKLNALSLGDLFACAAPIGLFFGRIANFIKPELYGRPWDGPWAMQFPIKDRLGEIIDYTVLRHPSQLYEAALEGLVLFAVIRIATHSFAFLKRPGATIGLFLAGYAASRIFIENFRQPDAQMPDFPLGLTMGMLLSAPMLALGVWLIWRTRTKAKEASGS